MHKNNKKKSVHSLRHITETKEMKKFEKIYVLQAFTCHRFNSLILLKRNIEYFYITTKSTHLQNIHSQSGNNRIVCVGLFQRTENKRKKNIFFFVVKDIKILSNANNWEAIIFFVFFFHKTRSLQWI